MGEGKEKRYFSREFKRDAVELVVEKFWTSGYYANTVGRYGNEKVIAEYVKDQGKSYKQIYRDQLKLFD